MRSRICRPGLTLATATRPGGWGNCWPGEVVLEGALRVWAQAYGERSSTTRQLAELLAERGDLEGAVAAWKFSDVAWQNPEGFREEFLSTLNPEDYLQETAFDPEDWAFMEAERLARLRAERDDGQQT